MATTPNQEAIEAFMHITGASEGLAFSTLEEHGGDLNEAVNSFFSEGDISITLPAQIPTSRNDFMDIDNDSNRFGYGISPYPLLSARSLNPFSLLDPNFQRSLFEGTSFTEFTSGAPRVTHPREVREIRIECKDKTTQPSHSGLSPAIEDVTGTPYAHGPETYGTVTMDDEDEDIQTDLSAYSSHLNETEVGFLGGRDHGRNHSLDSPAIDSVTDYTNEIEEEMIRAAIEASKREVVEGLPNQHRIDSSGPSVQLTGPHVEDPDLARAVSLSLKWGGISSEEHAAAVMLEAALFGGIPETTGNRFAYPPQEQLQTSSARGFYPQPVLHPPSPNLEAQRLLREQQDDEYLASLQADREKELKVMEEAEARCSSEKAAREASLEEEIRKEEETHRKLLKQEEIERQLAAKEASLPVEPALGDDNVVTLRVRMPDGKRCSRRFLKSDNLQCVFDFIDVDRVVKPGTYRLVRPYPRRAFKSDDSKLSLSELGLTGKQEALFLELI